MEYVYAAMLLHKAGKQVEEAAITKVVEAAGIKPDLARIRSLVAALEGVDIEKVIKETAIAPTAQAALPAAQAEKGEKKEEEEKKSEEMAAAGLGALFG